MPIGLQSGLALVATTALTFVGCASPNISDVPRTASTAVTNVGNTKLAQELSSALTHQPDLSGLHALGDGKEAFLARVVLTDAAEKSLDLQYYIWNSDDTGKLLAQRLIHAADRGVRVRLLLDDVGATPSDQSLLAMDSHTNVQVRLFNPLTARKRRVIRTLFEFSRINRRMHNKSFTADNLVTIVGGRNVGDEYFAAGGIVDFADLDVMAIGPVVQQVSVSFDLYWNTLSSVPITMVNRTNIPENALTEGRAHLLAHTQSMTNSPYAETLRETTLAEQLLDRGIEWVWGRAWTVFDHPEKVFTSPSDTETHLLPQLRPVIDATRHELIIISPYFVPGAAGVAFFEALLKRGVRVIILTNSLGATDVAAVHAGYRRYRKALLRAGVELYEMKATAKSKTERSSSDNGGSGITDSSRASLHAKTFIFDRRTAFIGSLNLDPRSVRLNTEIGVVLESPQLAEVIARRVVDNLSHAAYRLEAVPGPGPCKECVELNWITEENGETVRYSSEPDVGLWRRFSVHLLSLLPIESQL